MISQLKREALDALKRKMGISGRGNPITWNPYWSC